MVLCVCKDVSDHEVDQLIGCGAQSVDAVAQACGAGTDCGTCVNAIERRLGAVGSQGPLAALLSRGLAAVAAARFLADDAADDCRMASPALASASR